MQLRRLELKLKLFSELETMLTKECDQVEKGRQRFCAERARILSAKAASAGVASSASLPATAFGMTNNSVVNSGQQIMSALSSQPSISGYNNQSMRPRVPFMNRQPSPMYGFGPRFPLTTIQPNSASPNLLFNSPGNSQPMANQSMLRPGGSRSNSSLS